MGFHKATKFPFEVTKGKSKELFQLRFMRKSELEPNLRHNFRLNICQMGRQLDMWFKEQVYTIGSLKKEQDKFYQSYRRLRKEIRQAKKRDYVRLQEQIREKLQKIKINMMAMKVIHKWRSNVRLSKLENELELEHIRNTVGKSDLKVVNEPQSSMNSNTLPCDSDEKMTEETDGNNSYPRHRNDETNVTHDIPEDNGSFVEDYNLGNELNIEHEIYSDTDIDSGPDFDDVIPDDVDSLNGSRYPSSQGPRMETIPEEAVETEINDHRGLPRLTKRRLNLLNRSHSKRNVFEGNDQVPLLPDLGVHSITQQSHHSPPDHADKETQTSEKLEQPGTSKKKGTHSKIKSNTTQAPSVPRKEIVVKLPSNPNFHSRDIDPDSGKFKNEASDSDGSDIEDGPYGAFMYTNHQQTDSDEHDDNDADDESSPNHALRNGHSSTLIKYKTTLHRKSDCLDHATFAQNLPTVNNIKPHLPPASPLGNHSPFPTHYKERSFHVKPDYYDYACGNSSSRTNSRANNEFERHNRSSHRNGWKSTEDMRQRLESESHPHMSARPNMAVFGRKPNSVTQSITPPNSPSPSTSQIGMKGMLRNSRSNITNVLYTQKRAKAAEQKKIHDIVVKEPVQQYERTRSGRIKPLGTPRSPTQELSVPSLKEQYYRHKLLKSERDSILKQNIKLKRFMNFMDAFKKERNSTVLPPIARDSVDESETDGTTAENKPKRTIGNLFFKVQQSEPDPLQKRKIVPGAATTSLRLLRDCRYLREYKPMSVEDKMALYPDKESSWNMHNNSQYVANVKIDSM